MNNVKFLPGYKLPDDVYNDPADKGKSAEQLYDPRQKGKGKGNDPGGCGGVLDAPGDKADRSAKESEMRVAVAQAVTIAKKAGQMPGSMDLAVRFLDESSRIEQRDFDLVVLSVGMEPSYSIVACASQLGIELNDFGFCKTDRFLPLSTSRPGVFVGGAGS